MAADGGVALDMDPRADGGGETDAVVAEDAGARDADRTALAQGDSLYRPDNGPTHEMGRSCPRTAEEIPRPLPMPSWRCDHHAPGTYAFDQLIRIRNDGQAEARIFCGRKCPTR